VEYQDRDDTAVYVKFPIIGRARPPASAKATAGKPDAPAPVEEADSFPNGTSIAIWTTTPWTLPANLAIAVDAKENYVVQEFEVAHASGSRDPRNRDGRATLVLAEKLVTRFSAATGLQPVGSPLASFSGIIPWLILGM
jgi:isoleucyl-tRNA synthetase